ncbi:acyltransferase domain-containing protein [Catenulispora sp. NF23]|uniref:type I polyketide synthase n=1 Tax=Catenulispora pinistramenti TaxID=2705254 RepID=UPI001BAAC768|nr:type I polyketide synthase [Catenulispora pinistramenti]MBS2533103.1 acyltransferase domain-containing protein [Catenulispora pinistramenti]
MTRIAVIGIAGRFPQADDVRAFWNNLVDRRDCLTRLSKDDLAGLVPTARLDHPRFVAASGVIDGVFEFDAGMYAMAPGEAVSTDPQHRLFLDFARQALEVAGIVPGATKDIGVYAGVGRSRHEAMARAALGTADVDDVLLETGNEKDYFAGRVCYRLGLTGPSVVVQSACSTGLLAVHQACLALTGYECDVALAGAAAIRVPLEYGYVFRHGGIGSETGRCLPFSADADGTVAGDGLACLVLKRLEDAEADGDHIHAVLLGSAANNDGAKPGFAAVSAAGQTRVMESALRFSGLDPAQVGYLEAHGSATALGDATEWTAIERVYRHGLTVGAVKGNVGHLREASGLAGLIKTIQVVDTGVVPGAPYEGRPAAFTREQNARSTPARETTAWASPNDPRRAAVSSFGLGGTNVHLLLEQYERPTPAAQISAAEVLTITAHAAAPLAATARQIASALEHEDVPLAGAARTLQERRAHLRYRWAVTDLEELTESEAAPTDPVQDDPAVGFVFSGIGDHYPGMAAGLLDQLPGYRDLLFDALSKAGPMVGRDLRSLIQTAPARPAGGIDLRAMLRGRTGEDGLQDTVSAHVVMFCLQQALAGALAGVGVTPAAVMGHSIGELAAATVGGVFAPEHALDIVVQRARLVAGQPEGGMLAVALPGAEAAELTGPGIWLATVNTPSSSALAGKRPALTDLAAGLRERGIQARMLDVTHAFHTPMLAEAAEGLRALLSTMPAEPPRIPLVSGLTADWAGPEITRPEHWAAHLSSTVRFGQAVERLADRCTVLVEIGPGQLRSVAGQTGLAARGVVTVPTVRRSYEETTDARMLTRALGRVWQAGVDVDWSALRAGRRVTAAPMPARAADRRTHRASMATEVSWWQPTTDVSRAAATAVTAARAAAGGTVATTAAAAPEIAFHDRLARIWCTVLGVDQVRPRDHFFDLGGDSLMGVRLIALLEAATGVHVPSAVVFESAVLSRMARIVDTYLNTEERTP